MMKMSLITKFVLLAAVSGLVACGGSDKKGGNNTSSAAASSTPASSSAASSSVMSNVMELGKEYPYTANTKITNTGSTDLVVTQKYYWETQETKVVLVEGSATID
jgi:hypothetical protein